MLKCLVSHHWAEVGAADADVDDVANALAGVPLPRAASHAVGKIGHPVEYGVDLRHHVLAVHDYRCTARGSQGHMQNGPVFRQVDLVSPEHGVDTFAQTGLLGEATQQRNGLFVDAIFRVIEIDANRFRRQALAACRVIGEERAEMQPSDRPEVVLERLPCLARDEWRCLGHR